MKPATPLPWRANQCGIYDARGSLVACTGDDDGSPQEQIDMAAYIARSANAYPRLVQALKALVEAEEIYGDQESVALNEVWLPAAVLLRDLGEL